MSPKKLDDSLTFSQITNEGCTVLTKLYRDPKWLWVEDVTMYCVQPVFLTLEKPRQSSRHHDHKKNWEH